MKGCQPIEGSGLSHVFLQPRCFSRIEYHWLNLSGVMRQQSAVFDPYLKLQNVLIKNHYLWFIFQTPYCESVYSAALSVTFVISFETSLSNFYGSLNKHTTCFIPQLITVSQFLRFKVREFFVKHPVYITPIWWSCSMIICLTRDKIQFLN